METLTISRGTHRTGKLNLGEDGDDDDRPRGARGFSKQAGYAFLVVAFCLWLSCAVCATTRYLRSPQPPYILHLDYISCTKLVYACSNNHYLSRLDSPIPFILMLHRLTHTDLGRGCTVSNSSVTKGVLYTPMLRSVCNLQGPFQYARICRGKDIKRRKVRLQRTSRELCS